MTQEEKDKEIACTINTSMQLANIMGIDRISIREITEKTHARCRDINDQDVSIFLRMSAYDLFEENGEQYLKY